MRMFGPKEKLETDISSGKFGRSCIAGCSSLLSLNLSKAGQNCSHLALSAEHRIVPFPPTLDQLSYFTATNYERKVRIQANFQGLFR